MENFLFCRNGVNVEGATHRQVVELIKNGGDCLTMVVISVSEADIDRLSPFFRAVFNRLFRFDYGEESYFPYRHDYSESRSLPLTIPSYRTLHDGLEKYVVGPPPPLLFPFPGI